MRLAAFVYAGLAVAVWWHPMPKLAQSFALAVTAVLFMALRSAFKRLDRARMAAQAAKDDLRGIQVRNEAAQADITEKLDNLTRFVQRKGQQR